MNDQERAALLAWLEERILRVDLAMGAMPYGGINFDMVEYHDLYGQWKAFFCCQGLCRSPDAGKRGRA